MKVIIDWVYKNRRPRFYRETSPTLRAGKCGSLIVLVSPKIKLEDLYICEECARIHLWENNAQNVRELSHLEISSMLHDIETGNIRPVSPAKK